MTSIAFLKRRFRPVLLPALGICVIAYLGYHAMQGDHGVIARSRLAGQTDEARATLEALRVERQRLQHRTELLAPDGIDLDMLDERIRTMLNYGHPDDVVIYFGREDAAPAP